MANAVLDHRRNRRPRDVRVARRERRRRLCEDMLLDAFSAARPELTQALTRLLGSAEDAQDAVQEAFLQCWRNRDLVWGVRNLRAWVFRVGLNAGRDLQRNVWRRRAKPLYDHAEHDESLSPSPCDLTVRNEDLNRLRLAVAELRPEEREVFLLRQNSDLTYEEIAARRRLPVGTVKTQMRAALHKLRAVLQERNT